MIPVMKQMAMPFYCDNAKLEEFLTRVLAIEQEQDRLREDLRALKDEYAEDFPMRGVLAAVKMARVRWKLIHHPKEPMRAADLEVLVAYVEQHMLGLDQALEALARLEASGEQIEVLA